MMQVLFPYFFDKCRFQLDLADTCNPAINIVVAIDKADITHFCADFHNGG